MMRLSWERECRVLVASPIKVERASPCIRDKFLQLAKEGIGDDNDFYRSTRNQDIEAAQRLVQKTLDQLYLARIRIFINMLPKINGLCPILIAPLREGSKNVLTKKAAHQIAHILGLEVDNKIVEIPKGFSRKSQRGLGKLLNLPSYDGVVEEGRFYLATDDVIRTGGTLAELRSFIEIRGGYFAGACSLASVSGQDHVLNNTPEQLSLVEQSLTAEMIKWFENRFCNPIDRLTASEAYLLATEPVKSEIALAM